MTRNTALVAIALLCNSCSSCKPDATKGAPSGYPPIGIANPWFDLGRHYVEADRGHLIGCAHGVSLSQEQLAGHLFFPKGSDPPIGGAEIFVAQYASELRPGVIGPTTALLYLPTGKSTSVPIVILDHGGSGMGPRCGPSHIAALTDPIAIPLVARGYAVLAPDYAGMGVDTGMTSFLVGRAEAAASVDGLKALRQLDDPRFSGSRLGKQVFVVGHSQGGHAALFTAATLAGAEGVELSGTVAIAPALGSAKQWSRYFSDASRPTGGMEVSAAMSFYAHAAARGGGLDGWLSPRARARFPTIVHDTCLPELAGAVARELPTVGDLYDPAFLDAARSCAFDEACPGFEPWASELIAEEPRGDAGTPTLLLQGLDDLLVDPGSVRCISESLRARGGQVEACAFAGADHVSVLSRAIGPMLTWLDARRRGVTVSVCKAPLVARCPTQP